MNESNRIGFFLMLIAILIVLSGIYSAPPVEWGSTRTLVAIIIGLAGWGMVVFECK